MKTLLTLFVLFFSFSSVAEDITDFEIEGMSIGDSLLDYLTIDDIKKNEKASKFKSKNYIKIVIIKEQYKIIKNYDYLNLYVNKGDNQFRIAAINGDKYTQNIQECLNLQKEVSLELKKTIENANFTNLEKLEHPGYKDTMTHTIYFSFVGEGEGKVACIEPSEKLRKQNYKDVMKITIGSFEYTEWLRTAYD